MEIQRQRRCVYLAKPLILDHLDTRIQTHGQTQTLLIIPL
jgi:hypothetical protein